LQKEESRIERMKRRGVPLICLLLAICMACTLPAPGDFGSPASTNPGEVPFELAAPNDAAIIVPVKINGQGPFKFVLDTGATFTCLDQKLVDELKLPEWRGGFGVGVLMPTEGNVRLVSLNTFEVGNVKATEMKACAIDFARLQTGGLSVRGLVGLNFLKSFQVRIDFQKRVLHLESPR
jgi:predicted aspartyl protease